MSLWHIPGAIREIKKLEENEQREEMDSRRYVWGHIGKYLNGHVKALDFILR